MKAKNLNNSSKKTRNLIKNTFAEMLSEKKEINKISVTELVKRANINRGTFYTHYNDIYEVAEDFSNELIDKFFSNDILFDIKNVDQFIETFFKYLQTNDKTYKLLCKSDDSFFFLTEYVKIVSNKFLEICINSPKIKKRTNLQLEINIFLEGLVFEYIKYCRELSQYTLIDLYNYSKIWFNNFVELRS